VAARDIAASSSLDEKTTISAAIIKIISIARIRFKMFLQKLPFGLQKLRKLLNQDPGFIAITPL